MCIWCRGCETFISKHESIPSFPTFRFVCFLSCLTEHCMRFMGNNINIVTYTWHYPGHVFKERNECKFIVILFVNPLIYESIVCSSNVLEKILLTFKIYFLSLILFVCHSLCFFQFFLLNHICIHFDTVLVWDSLK